MTLEIGWLHFPLHDLISWPANAGVCQILGPCPKDRDHDMPGEGMDNLFKNDVFDKHRFCINSI